MVETTPAPSNDLPWARRVLLRVEVGSTAHGTGLPGGEDYDEMGVMAETWQHAIGLPVRPERKETIVYRPGKAVGERSDPGDYDLVVHSARKFCSLAAQGNPSVLMALFGPLRFSTELGDRLRAMAPVFWSQQARPRFLGYSRAQRERLMGVRGGRHTNRPELVAVHGYDTKYAMHMLRLGLQGIEYMRAGRLELPIPGERGEMLREVRRGEWTLDHVLDLANRNERELAAMESGAPERPDLYVINGWLADVFDWERDR